MRPIKNLFALLVFVHSFLLPTSPCSAASSGDRSLAEVLELVQEEFRDDVGYALEAAGENASEIEAAIRALEGDERRAACFLISQLPYRCAVLPEGEKVVVKTDAECATQELITSHVKLSFQAREKFPWTVLLSEEDFFKYVLAMRGQTEKLEDWRKILWENREFMRIAEDYSAKFEGAEGDARSAVFRELVHALNEWLAARAKYAPRGMPDLTPGELLAAGTGRCTDLTNAYLAILRTFGIAATGVRAIWWPKENGNHYWARILDPASGEWYDIDAGLKGELKDEYFTVYRFRKEKSIAKIYRVTPGEEKGSISGMLRPRKENLPTYVNFYLVAIPMVDITSEFTDVCTISFEDMEFDEVVSLCVFNNSQWLEVAAAVADEDGNVVFENVGVRDILYMPTYCEGSGGALSQVAAGRPFVLRRDGKREEFETEFSKGLAIEKEVIVGKTEAKQCFSLRYWDDSGWRHLERVWSDSEGKIPLKGPRAGILYALWNEAKDEALRPFSVSMRGEEVLLEQY